MTEEPVPDVSREDARAALDAVLVTQYEVRRRLAGIARREPDLRNLAARIGPLYLNGADR